MKSLKTNQSSVQCAVQSLEPRRLMAAAPYSITPLQSDTGFTTDSVGINQTWQILGGDRSPGVWQQGCGCAIGIQYKPLGQKGLSGGVDPRAINATGWVIGSAKFAGDPANSHAALWRPVKKKGWAPTDLGVLPGGAQSFGRGVNNAGEVVGYSDVGGGVDHAFIARPGKKGKMSLVDLNTLRPAGSDYLLDSASNISNNGQIIGLGKAPGVLGYSAFFMELKPAGNTVTPVKGLTYKFSEFGARLKSLNEKGQAVGFSKVNDAVHGVEEHAILWQMKNGQQKIVDLNPTGDDSYALDINNAGQVVGEFEIPGNSQTHGFLYQTNKKGKAVFIDLNTMIGKGTGVTITSATGINESGLISAIAVDGGGRERAVLLNSKTKTAIPAASPAAIFSAKPIEASHLADKEAEVLL